MNLSRRFVLFCEKNNFLRCYSTNIKPVDQFESMACSFRDKGFLRPYKGYTAPSNVDEKVLAICATLNIPGKQNYHFKTLEEKFKVLEACFKDFRHSVPNSEMYELNTMGDIIKFYKTSVNSTVPYDKLKQMQLPPNLHIQYDYVRFHPEKDTRFNGKSAFPKSSTLVTGLKYRGKYEGYEAKRSWP